MPCQWNDSQECQLAAYTNELSEYDGKFYCPFHLPLESDHKLRHQQFSERFYDLLDGGARDFTGVTFPGNDMYTQGSPVYRINREVKLGQISLGPSATIALENVSGDVPGATFYPNSILSAGSPGDSVVCNGATMTGQFTFDGISQAMVATFDRSKFQATCEFKSLSNLKALSFVDCIFATAPRFGLTPQLPQDTRFRGATFTARPEDEPVYRSIRQHFTNNDDRDSEGKFYALEKRCQRLGLRLGVTRAISFLYDLFSEYGQSYVRALGWFCAVQAICIIVYAKLSNRLDLGGNYDGRVIQFTFAQLVKPFELFSGSAPMNGPFVIINAHRGLWLFLTAAQSIASFALLALFLLALRWRFKRA
jgi:hypothetical protein